MAKAKKVSLKGLKTGDAVEIVWKDATTAATWLDPGRAAEVHLETIVTRGTLVAIRADALVVALDASINSEGGITAYHGSGVIEINSVAKARKLR